MSKTGVTVVNWADPAVPPPVVAIDLSDMAALDPVGSAWVVAWNPATGEHGTAPYGAAAGGTGILLEGDATDGEDAAVLLLEEAE